MGRSGVRIFIKIKCDVGYSRYEKGYLLSVLAVAVGTTVIERHIALDKKMYGCDQAASVDEKDLTMMMQQIRGVPENFGPNLKSISDKKTGC